MFSTAVIIMNNNDIMQFINIPDDCFSKVCGCPLGRTLVAHHFLF